MTAPEVDDLDALSPLSAELVRRASLAGARLIWRAQARSTRSVSVQSGRTEASSSSLSAGQGIQAFRDDGRMAFASRDDFRTDAAIGLFEKVLQLADAGADLGVHPIHAPRFEPTRARAVPAECAGFARINLPEVSKRLVELGNEANGSTDGVSFRLDYSADLDAWRVVRDDGSDVLFAIPRAVLRITAIAASSATPHRVGVSASGPAADLPFQDSVVLPLLERARQAARLARQLGDAPFHPAGSFPVVLDYALAKGLAHEAFGHASEADGFRSSILAKDGRFRAGELVGARHVSVVDEPVPGDHAWQPYSANGLPRRRATLVDHGILHEGLTDPWSAPPGTAPIDAARCESFQSVPLPRMTNIRIEVDDPLSAPEPFERYGPEEVRDLLTGAGVFKRHPRIVYLSGYSGGQVNPATGDFVFHCKAIYALTRDGLTLHRPAIFSGSMFGALGAVREAFGPLRLDAIGTCGKWGQRVPSSGGSHYFLVLDPHPSVRLGGAFD